MRSCRRRSALQTARLVGHTDDAVGGAGQDGGAGQALPRLLDSRGPGGACKTTANDSLLNSTGLVDAA